MPNRRRPKGFGSEPLVTRPVMERVRGVKGPGPGGLRPSFQAQTRGLTPREQDMELLRQGILEPGDVQARRARRGR